MAISRYMLLELWALSTALGEILEVTRSYKKMEKRKALITLERESQSSAGLPCMTGKLERCRYGAVFRYG